MKKEEHIWKSIVIGITYLALGPFPAGLMAVILLTREKEDKQHLPSAQHVLQLPSPLVWVDNHGVHFDANRISLTRLQQELIWQMHWSRSQHVYWSLAELQGQRPVNEDEVRTAMSHLETHRVVGTYYSGEVRYYLRPM